MTMLHRPKTARSRIRLRSSTAEMVSVLEPFHLRSLAPGPLVASGVWRLPTARRSRSFAAAGLRRGGDALASLNIPAAALPTTSFGRPAPPVPWSPESIANSSSGQETPGSASEIAEVDPTSVRSGS